MFKEKREFPRANMICKISVVFGERLLVFNVHTENIGEKGVRIILEHKLHPPTDVDLELFVSSREKSVKCKGQIAWVKEMVPKEIKTPLFDTGIRFIDIDASDREEIKSLIKDLLSKEREIKN